jgi:hypothetical protein
MIRLSRVVRTRHKKSESMIQQQLRCNMAGLGAVLFATFALKLRTGCGTFGLEEAYRFSGASARDSRLFKGCSIQAANLHTDSKLRGNRATTVPRWVPVSVYASSGFFIFLLLFAAFFAPSIRVLHVLQSLIYVAVILFVRRNSAWGFGAGCFIASFWNYIFLRGAAADIWALLTGRVIRPDVGLQLAGALAHFILIAACLTGFLIQSPEWKNWAKFLSAGLAAIGYLVVLMITLRPQYVPLLERCFGL